MSPLYLCDICGVIGVGREDASGYRCRRCELDDYAAEWDRAVEEMADRFESAITATQGDPQ